MTHGLRPGKPGPRAAKPITPPYVENNYRIEVKITFMLIAYLVLLCEFFWEFSIFHFCRPPVDIYWHPLLIILLSKLGAIDCNTWVLWSWFKEKWPEQRIRWGWWRWPVVLWQHCKDLQSSNPSHRFLSYRRRFLAQFCKPLLSYNLCHNPRLIFRLFWYLGSP